MTFRSNDGDRDKFDHSLHHYPTKKFDHSIHYYPQKIIHPEQKYYEIKKLECNSIYCNGTSSYINCVNNASLSITDVITISVWIKPKTNDLHQRIISKNNAYTLVRDATTGLGNIQLYLWGSALRSPVISIPKDEWAHIVVVADDALGKLYSYKNGKNIGTPTAGFISIQASGNDLNIAGDVFFNGSVNKLRIYNRALSALEILNLYQNKNILNNNLVLDLPMTSDYSTKNIITDKSGNTNHGTLIDCEWNCDWVREKHKVI